MVERFERFSYAIFEISRCWHKLAAEEMARYGLKGSHAIYLLTLLRHGEGLTAAQICELCGRDKADVSRAVSVMEEKGLAVREGINSSLYRAALRLTEAGTEAARQVCLRAATAVEHAGKGISDEHRQIFYASLETITANLQSLSKEGLPDNL